ncbi:MAG: hypothetical protein MUD03_15940, partial [Pirellula sp.]|nr:hypothetical protein [Pirellula sp.]
MNFLFSLTSDRCVYGLESDRLGRRVLLSSSQPDASARDFSQPAASARDFSHAQYSPHVVPTLARRVESKESLAMTEMT